MSALNEGIAQLQDQVSGHMAFWALVLLALNVIVQPVGTICGFPPRYRLYLRCSPVFCVLDLVSLLLRFLTYMSHFWHLIPNPVLVTFKAVVDSKQIKGEDDPGSQGFEKLPVLRKILAACAFVQAMRLFACEGIPWTVACAYFYIVPFLVYETVCSLTTLMDSGPHLASVDVEKTYSRRIAVLMDSIDRYLGVTAFVLHFAILSHLFWELVWYDTWLLLTLTNAPLIFPWIFLKHFRILNVKLLYLPVGAHILVYVYCVWPEFLVLWDLRLVPLMIKLYFGIQPVILWPYIFHVALRQLAAWGLCSVENFLLKKDEVLFLFFVSVILVAVCGYAFLYDPLGTVKPQWAGPF
jgi:hypothetical protein